jgi:hypothetical protein
VRFYFAVKKLCYSRAMVAAPRVLPDLNQLDPASLKALIFLQHEQLLSKDAQLIAHDNEIVI